MVQKERKMKAVATEHDKMMMDIMDFTSMVVGIAEMRDIPANIRADGILVIEQAFHKMIMEKIVEKCVEKSIPCNN